MPSRQETARKALKHMFYNPKAKLDPSQIENRRIEDIVPNSRHSFYSRFEDANRKKDRPKTERKFIGRNPKLDGPYRKTQSPFNRSKGTTNYTSG